MVTREQEVERAWYLANTARWAAQEQGQLLRRGDSGWEGR